MDRLGKKQTELYIGCTQLEWDYIEVPYKADCTEALPLTIMDKVICGLLDIDGKLTAAQLGNILGLNINDDPQNGEYKDLAEACILKEALDSLLDYGMIKRGSSSGLYTLTDIGREYYGKGRKFRTTRSRSFKVYFDRVTSKHSNAEKIFAGVSGERKSIKTPKRFYDENFLKAFIHEQNPSLYDIEKGNSFTNLSCPDSVDVIKVSLKIAVLYDVITRSFRFEAFIGNRPSAELTEYIASYETLYEKVVDNIKEMLKDSVKSEDSLSQRRFEETLMENPFSVIEPEMFWDKLDEIVGYREKDIFVNVDTLDEGKCRAIASFCNNRPQLKVFLSFGASDVQIPHVQNLFCMEKVMGDDYILCGANATYAVKGYVIKCRDKKLHANMVFRYAHAAMDLYAKKRFFAQELLPGMIADVLEYLNGDIEIAKESVEQIAKCDSRLEAFGDFIDQETLQLIGRKKDEAIIRVEQGLAEAFEQSESEKGRKTYIVDTNVFLDDPDILSKFRKEDRVILSGQVLEELDKKKNMAGDKALSANARNAVNAIIEIMDRGKYSKSTFLETVYADMSLLPEELQSKKADNYILGVAAKYIGANPRMLTSDNILRVKAESIGIPAISLKAFYKENGL